MLENQKKAKSKQNQIKLKKIKCNFYVECNSSNNNRVKTL